MSENVTKKASKGSSEVKSMLHDAWILFVITLVAGIVLGFVYQITKEPIARQEKKAKDAACKAVFADAASFEELPSYSPEAAEEHLKTAGYSAQRMSDVVRAARNDRGELLGYVLTITSSEGYGGDITFAMGIRMDGTLNGISFLSISETPGLGMRAEEVLSPQFMNKNVTQFEYTKSGAVSDSQIDAISGATITTNAVTNGVNAGMEYFRTVLKEGK